MFVSDVLVEARRGAGLTQTEMARRARTSQAAVARYEAGAVSPAVTTLERLLRVAGRCLDLRVHRAPPADLDSGLVRSLRSQKARVVRICQQSGAREVRLVGSPVFGASPDGSRVDLLVVFDLRRGLMPALALADHLRESAGVDAAIVPVGLLYPDQMLDVLDEAVPL